MPRWVRLELLLLEVHFLAMLVFNAHNIDHIISDGMKAVSLKYDAWKFFSIHPFHQK
jgi:hypothetical protein